jgi:hypothetical protein
VGHILRCTYQHVEALARLSSMRLIALCAALMVTACATPAGQFSPEDFISTTATLNVSSQLALLNFYSGLRSCGKELGVAECAPPRPDGSSMCDVYLADLLMARSQWVVGRVEFSPSGANQTLATFRVNNTAMWPDSFKHRQLAAWERAARGSVGECR